MSNKPKVKGDYGLIVRLLLGIVVGVAIGLACGEKSGIMQAIGSIQHFCGQIIFFTVPLVILAFIGPAIIRVGANASKMLFTAVAMAYASSVGAACFAYFAGSALLPFLKIDKDMEKSRQIGDIIFKFGIPPLMSVMTALVTALLFGLAVLWTKSKTIESIWYEFERCILQIINKVIIPVLPVFISATFAILAYEGSITRQAPAFLKIIIVAIIGHFIWMFILYTIAGVVSKKSPWEVVRHYVPAYLTAVGTMSSAATLPVSLECARKSKVLSKSTVEFMIPLGATIHLCGSVLTETLFVLAISQILYGTVPPLGTMILFIILFGFFAVGAPGVPGGTVMASLGLVIAVLGFDSSGTALLIAIFALQDSFGTACNVTADGALALMIEGIFGEQKTG